MILSIATLFFFFKIIANKNEHTSSVLVNLANKMAKRENIDTLKKKIEEVKQTQEKINEHFVDSTKIDSFVDYLEKLGTSGSTEVKVESFELSVADKNTLQVKLSTKGTFSNVMRTMMLLENTPYQVHITNVSLNKQSGDINIDPKTGKVITTTASTWQSTISFSILTS
jgi:arginine utilization protein RocB